jgi:transcriptional regulator with XRE-family HTH domain
VRKALELMRENAEKRRLELGLSYKEIAEACGTTPPDINRWLKGKGTIGLDKLDALARALKVTPSQLLRSPDDPDHDIKECLDRVSARALRGPTPLEALQILGRSLSIEGWAAMEKTAREQLERARKEKTDPQNRKA